MSIREIVLDTETTGLDPKNGHRIVEIGAVEMVNKIRTGREFHCYINPQRNMPFDAYQIHGISSEFLKDKPLFEDIADEFIKFIESGILVIHNAAFDIKFLNYELGLLKKPSLQFSEVVDTLSIARKLFPGLKVNLDALCKKFKINNTDRLLHGALKDARLLAEVYVELSGGRQVSLSINQKIETEITLKEEKLLLAKGNNIVISPTKEELLKHEIFINEKVNKNKMTVTN